MRLVLPTGPDGEDREYPADGLVLGATMAECQALLLHTGLSQDYVLAQLWRGGAKDAPKVTQDADLLRAHMGMVWLARYRAGERQEDGKPFTLDGACDFPLRQLRWRPDPGDLAEEKGEDKPDPGRPSAGGRGTAGGKAKNSPRSRGSASRGKRS